jgi:4-amino-4-deoxy-L-arabinose transferase-like glycosyltransferase
MPNLIEEGSNIFSKNVIICLGIIALAGFLIRFFYFPEGVPITHDGSAYFWYANDLSISGTFPDSYPLNFPNNGWPTFLSVFFALFNSDNFLDYMNLQRSLSIMISVLTIIPIYLLCSRFFDKRYSIIGAALFVFEPLIIQNSLLGITEPLFLFIGITSLFLFLSNNIKAVYISFGVAALFTLVRYEGLLLLLPLSIMFFVRFKKEKKVILKYGFCVLIFVLVVSPMAYIRFENTGQDGIISHVVAVPVYYQAVSEKGERDQVITFFNLLISGLLNLSKYLGWITIPFFIFFIPYGVFVIFKNRDYKTNTIILTSIILLLPAVYAYTRDFQDPRYLFVLFPIFTILSVYTIKKLETKLKKQNLFCILLIGGIVGSSLVFLNYQIEDYEHQREAFEIAKEVTERTSVINHSYHIDFDVPESKYYRSAKIASLQTFPILSTEIQDRIEWVELVGHDSLESYIGFGKKQGLTYLVVDDSINQPPFLQDVFIHEEKYPYLLKEFDSKDFGYQYHVKIFRINYEVLK